MPLPSLCIKRLWVELQDSTIWAIWGDQGSNENGALVAQMKNLKNIMMTYKVHSVCQSTLMVQLQPLHLNTIGACWYFWKGIWASKAHEPVTLSGNPTFTKV